MRPTHFLGVLKPRKGGIPPFGTRRAPRGCGPSLGVASFLLVSLLVPAALAAGTALVSPSLPGSTWSAITAPSAPGPSDLSSGSPLSSSTPLQFSLEIALSNSPAQQAFEAGLEVPGSPSYHHYLSLEQTYQDFGPTPGLVNALLAYLRGEGLTVTHTSGPLLYQISGPAGEVDSALHTSIVLYPSSQGPQYAPSEPPSLPSALAPAVEGILGLDQFDAAKPTILLSHNPAGAATTPTTMREFYNSSGLISGGDTGSNFAIGLAEECDPLQNYTSYQPDVNSFDSTYGLPAITLNEVGPGWSKCSLGYPGWGEETDLDVQWAHAMAPGAALYVCLDTTIPYDCDQWFVNNSVADNIEFGSNSWGGPASDKAVWTAAMNAGVTLLASAGDGCSEVVFPAEDSNGLAVGGTTITPAASGGFDIENDWSCSGSGSSSAGTGGGCDSSDPTPSWQTGMTGFPGVCPSTDRGIPDVAMDANPSSGVEIIYNGITTTGVGGTSLACPMWAATLDVIYTAAGVSQLGASDFAPPEIYALAKSADYHTYFHDVVNGTNGNPTTPGWDPDTGVGTPNIGALASAWPRGSPSTGPFLVTFVDAPTYAGRIVFNGTTYYSGQSATFPRGNYTLSLVTLPAYHFSSFSLSPHLAYSAVPGDVDVTGAGQITATFLPYPTVSFTVVPAACGPLTFNGTAQASGSSVQVLTSYNPIGLSAPSCSGYTFSAWTSTGGVAFGSSTQASTTATVSANCTITATYSSPSLMTVSFTVTPASGGKISFQGAGYQNGQSVGVNTGTYTVAAFPSSGYEFASWSASGGVSTPSGGTVVVSASGGLTATFQAVANVTFVVVPSTCPGITYNGATESSGTVLSLALQSTSVAAASCAGYAFSAWSTSGSLQVSSTTVSPTTLTVGGAGTLTATYTAAPITYAVAVTIRPATCGPVTLGSSSAANGSTSQLTAGTYALSVPACTGYVLPAGVSATGGVAVNAAGSQVTVSGAGSLTIDYTPVPAPLSATVSGPSGGNVSQTLTWSVAIAGGTAPYVVEWSFGDGSSPTSQTVNGASTSGSHAYAVSGSYTLKVTVTDASGTSVLEEKAVTVQTSTSGNPNSTSSSWGSYPLWLLAALVAVVGVAVAAVVLAVMRRRRKSAEAPPGVWPGAPPGSEYWQGPPPGG